MDIIFKILRYLKKNGNLIKSVLMIALVIICVIQTITLTGYKSSYEEEVKSGSTNQAELDALRQENQYLESQISDHKVLLADKDNQLQQLQAQVSELETQVKELSNTDNSSPEEIEEYLYATQIWDTLTTIGLNKYVCAGIIGNIMAEVGGQTLDFSEWGYWSQGTHYGICQWGGSRKERLLNDFGPTFNDQVRFLVVELFEVIPKDNSFYNMQDEKEAALYFAKYYERCISKYYSVRQKNATKALEYFTK